MIRKKNPQDIARRIIEKMASGGMVEDESHELADDTEDMFSLDDDDGEIGLALGGEVEDAPKKKLGMIDRIRARIK